MNVDFEITCPLCKCPRSKRLFNKNGYFLVSCGYCGHVYVPIKPENNFFEKLYSKEYFSDEKTSGYGDYFAEKRAIELTAKSRLKRLDAFKIKSRRLLEIGCGTGFFLNVAKDSFHVTGVELSDFAALYAKKYFNLNVYQGTLDKASFTFSSFDVVVIWDVIEHIVDPIGLITEIKKILCPKGLLVFTTPNTSSFLCMLQNKSWRLFDPPYHLNYFSRKNDVKMLDSIGFKVLKIESTWEWHSFGYLFHALWVYHNKKLFRGLGKFLRKSRLGKINIPLNLFDIMTIYAIKEA